MVKKRSQPIAERAEMVFGSMPRDDGHLTLNQLERAGLLEAAPEVATIIKPYLGSREILRSENRYCLWVDDAQVEFAENFAEIAERFKRTESFRSESSNATTNAFAKRSHRFVEIRHQDSVVIAVPGVSSARRDYVPLAMLPSGTVLSNLCYAVYGNEPWLFGLLHSSMHMAWVSAVAGRMKLDYRYSNTLCYNTFPFPNLNDSERDTLSSSAFNILAARERWPDRSLAEMYDPDEMPANLRQAHEENDALVDSLYRTKPFGSDADRMEMLLGMYRDLVAEAEAGKSKKSTKGGK